MSGVVVTGGDGFIGRHLVNALVARGEEVTVLDSGPGAGRGRGSGGGLGGGLGGASRRVDGDIRDPSAVAAAIGPGASTVYHLAAVVGVDRYLARPLEVIDVNLTGTRNVLERAHAAGVRVVVASTSEVFGRNPAVPWAEDADRVLGSTATERWSYSSSKALAEHLTYAFIRQLGLDASIVRYFNVYGPGQRPAFVVSRCVHRALRGLPPLVYDDGGQTRCFTYVDDAVAATLSVADHPKATGESFNIGGAQETTVGRVAELVAELTGTRTERVETAGRMGGYQDLHRRIPDTAKARSVLGWENTVGLREGIERTIAWARANPWWLDQDESGFA